MLPVREAGAEGWGNWAIHELKCLQDERVVSRGRFHLIQKWGVNDADEKGKWKKGDTFIVEIKGREKVRAIWKGIWASKKSTKNMDHLKKIGKIQKSAGLSVIQGLELMEVVGILMVSEDT